MRNIKSLLLLLLLANISFAQLNVTVQMLPPYSVYFVDYLNYPNKTLITVQNTTGSDYNYYFQGTITGDNGVEVATNASYKPPQALFIPAFGVVTLSLNSLNNQFNSAASVQLKGVTYSYLYTKQALPEGNYTVCLEAYDYATQLPISATAPSGCSNIFSVKYIQPPVITYPVCGSTVTGFSVPNTTFSWLPATGMAMGLQYKLKIVEVVPSTRDINEAMNSATTPVFFEQTVSGYSFIYGSGYLPFENGKKYAFQVTAVDPTGTYYLVNEGKSEVCSFTYQAYSTYSLTTETTTTPTSSTVITPIATVIDLNTKVQGNLNYYYQSFKPEEHFALANTKVKLVTQYKLVKPGGESVILSPYFLTEYTDVGKVVATTTTDASGNFAFNLLSTNNPGLVNKAKSIFLSTSGETKTTTGVLYRVWQVQVDDDHYCNPTESIDAMPSSGNVINAGNLLSRTRDFNLVFSLGDGSASSTPSSSSSGSPGKPYYISAPSSSVLATGSSGSESSYSSSSVSSTFSAASSSSFSSSSSSTGTYELFGSYPNMGTYYYYGDESSNLYEAAPALNFFSADQEYEIKVYKSSSSSTYDGYSIMGTDYSDMIEIASGNTFKGNLTLHRLIKNIGSEDYYTVTIKPITALGSSAIIKYEFQFKYESGEYVGSDGDCPDKTDFAIYNSEYTTPDVPFSCLGKEIIMATSQISGKMQYQFPGYANKKAYANKTLTLQIQYVVKNGGEDEYVSGYSSEFPDNGTVLGVTTTDKNGNFSFDEYDTEDFGLVKANFNYGYDKIDGVPHAFYKGDLYRLLSIKVNSAYYTNPKNSFSVKAGEYKALDPLTANVRSYNLKVHLKSDPYEKVQFIPPGQGVKQMTVILLRINRPTEVPDNEVSATEDDEYFFSAEIIGKTITDEYGDAYFSNLVKNIGSNDNYSVYAYPSESGETNYYTYTQDFKYNCGTSSGGLTIPDNAYYNEQFYIQTFYKEMLVYPAQPVIKGKVARIDNPSSYLKDVKVESFVLPIIPFPLKEGEEYTNSKGEFRIVSYSNQYDKDGNLISLGRFLKLDLYGFDLKQVNNLGVLKKGQQQDVGLVLLNPSGHVTGKILGDDGMPVKSYVTIGNGATVESDYGTFVPDLLSGMFSTKPAKFECDAAFGSQSILLEPQSTNYFSESSTVNVTSKTQDLGTFTVYEKLHRMKIHVKPPLVKATGDETFYSLGTKFLQNAKVKIVDVGDTVLTDKFGNAEFKFSNASDNYQIYIQGPDGYDYEAKTISVYNDESKFTQVIEVELTPAAKIVGRVTVGHSPIPNARVFVEFGSPNLIQTFTNSSGYYTLHNVPKKDYIVVKAVKSSSNYIGATATVNTNTNKDSVNLVLKVYDKYDITQLWNIPIEVEELNEIGSTVLLTGAFVDIPANSQFKLTSSTDRLKFSGVSVKEGVNKNAAGIPYAVPIVNAITISEKNYADVTVYNKFKASQGDAVTGVQMVNANAEKGGLKGKVWVKDASFTTSDIDFNEDGFYLKLPNEILATDKANIISLYAGGSDFYTAPKGFLCVNKSLGNIGFTVYALNAEASSASSYLKKDTLKLNTILHTNISSLTNPDINLAIGNLNVLTNKICTVVGTNTINIAMDKWKLISTDWTLGKDGLQLKTGKLNAITVDVPFNNIYVKNDKLTYTTSGTFDLTSIKLLDLITVNSVGNCTFGNTGTNWQLTIVPKSGMTYCAEMKNIPDIGGKIVLLDNFYLSSNGINSFKLKANSFKVDNLVDFTTNNTTMGVYADYISLPGLIAIGVPLVTPQPTSVTVKKISASTLQTSLSTFGFEFTVNGLHADFMSGKTSITSSGFIAEGTLSEPGLFTHNVKLYKTPDSTVVCTTAGQSFNYTGGSQKLSNIWGRMYPTASSWSMYKFSGKVEGASSISGGLTFNVYGNISASDQKVSMDNFATPFGNLSLTYDYAQSRLVGNLDVNQDMGTGGSVHANVECLFDNQGWYFVAGGTITMPNNPYIKSANSAVLFGNYPNTASIPSINTVFTNYAYTHAVPSEFNNLKGFVTNCVSTFPPPDIPSFDLDLVVVSGSLSVDVTAGFQSGLNFTPDKDFVFTVGNLYGVHAHAGVGGSVGLVCAGASLDVTSTFSTAGTLSTSGAWEVMGNASLALTGSAYAGGGCCDSDCDDCCSFCVITHCFTDDWSGTIGVGAEAHMDSNGNNYLKFTY